MRTAPSSAAAVNVVRNASTAQKCESWIPSTQKDERPAANSAARRRAKRRVIRYTSQTVSRSKSPESARPTRCVPP